MKPLNKSSSSQPIYQLLRSRCPGTRSDLNLILNKQLSCSSSSLDKRSKSSGASVNKDDTRGSGSGNKWKNAKRLEKPLYGSQSSLLFDDILARAQQASREEEELGGAGEVDNQELQLAILEKQMATLETLIEEKQSAINSTYIPDSKEVPLRSNIEYLPTKVPKNLLENSNKLEMSGLQKRITVGYPATQATQVAQASQSQVADDNILKSLDLLHNTKLVSAKIAEHPDSNKESRAFREPSLGNTNSEKLQDLRETQALLDQQLSLEPIKQSFTELLASEQSNALTLNPEQEIFNENNISRFLGKDPDLYSNLQLTPSALNRMRNHLASLKHGTYASVPLICGGYEKCPIRESCWFAERHPVTKAVDLAASKFPLYTPCPVEATILQTKVKQYCAETLISPNRLTPSIINLATKLAELDIYEIRVNMIFSQGDRLGEGQDLMQEVVLTSHPSDGTPVATAMAAHPALAIKERLAKLRATLHKELLSTPETQMSIELKKASNEKDSSLGNMMGQLSKLVKQIAENTNQNRNPIANFDPMSDRQVQHIDDIIEED